MDENTKMYELALRLIQVVEGNECHVERALAIIDGVRQGVNNAWENHIVKETNEYLMIDNVVCDRCCLQMQIKRTTGLIPYKPC